MERHQQYQKIIWIWTLLIINPLQAQDASIPLECQFESTWGHDADVLPLSRLYHFYPDLKKQPTLIHGCDIGAAEQAGSLNQQVATLGYQELTLEQVDGNGDYGGSFEAGNGYLNPINFPAMDWNIHSSWSLEAINGYIGFMRMQQYHYAWLMREALRRIQTGLCQQATVKFNCAYDVWSNQFSKTDDYLTSKSYKDHLDDAKMRYEEYRLPIALDPLVILKTYKSPLTGINRQRWELTAAGKKNLTSKQNIAGILERDILEKANLQFNDDFKTR